MTDYRITAERTEKSIEYVVYRDEKFVVVMNNEDLENTHFCGGNDFLTEFTKGYKKILNENPKIKSIETKLKI
jgi:hypothetical protein